MFMFQTSTSSLKEVLEQLLEAVVSHADPSGRLVSELFQKLPSKVVSPCLGFGLQMGPLKFLHVVDIYRPVCLF